MTYPFNAFAAFSISTIATFDFSLLSLKKNTAALLSAKTAYAIS
jgi:hypothetical protein